MGFPPLWIEPAGGGGPPPVTPPPVGIGVGGSPRGVDIWLDVLPPEPLGVPAARSDIDVRAMSDRMVAGTGDWRLVQAEEALRQSILRRIVTDPGTWRTVPQYGVGAGLYVGATNTKASGDELANRVRAQLLRDDRILRVLSVTVEYHPDEIILNITYLSRYQALKNQAQTLVVGIT